MPDAPACLPFWARSGGFCGSTYVDERWESLCRDTVSPQADDAWRAQYPMEVLHMQAKWEAVKCGFDSSLSHSLTRMNLSSGAQSVSIPPGLRALIPTAMLQALRQAQGGIDDRILLSSAAICQLFDPVVDQVISLAKDQLLRGRRAGHVCNKVLLVGGFAQSPYLQRRIRAALGERLLVLVPPNPGSAVLQGGWLHKFRSPLPMNLVDFNCLKVMTRVFMTATLEPIFRSLTGCTTLRWPWGGHAETSQSLPRDYVKFVTSRWSNYDVAVEVGPHSDKSAINMRVLHRFGVLTLHLSRHALWCEPQGLSQSISTAAQVQQDPGVLQSQSIYGLSRAANM